MTDLTVVLGVDAKTAAQLYISAPTWAKYRPELFTLPWYVFVDGEQLPVRQILDLMTTIGKTADVRVFPWPTVATEYASQREKMLSGFCHVCRYVETPWWVKIDTDAIALNAAEPWPDPAWLAPDLNIPVDATAPQPYDKSHNVIIASPWGYTKPADQMATLDDWGDAVPGLREYPRLNIPYTPGGRRARHQRIASWVSFYRSDWSRMASDMARHYAGMCKIPVPSQDGYHYYVAARRGDKILRAQQKRRGWTNCPRLEQLKTTAAKALAGDYE